MKTIEHILIHKARKGDTIFSLTKRYEISDQQLLYYNPELKDGLKRKMKLKIPRYKKIPPPPKTESQANITYSPMEKALGALPTAMASPSANLKQQIPKWVQ